MESKKISPCDSLARMKRTPKTSHAVALTGALAVLAFAALPAVAQVAEAGAYPDIAPSGPACAANILPTANSNGFSRSRDCRTIFLHPPKFGTAIVRNLRVTTVPLDCEIFQQSIRASLELRRTINGLIADLVRQRSNSSDPKTRDDIQARINQLNADIEKIGSEQSNVVGATASMTFSNGYDSDYQGQFILKNIEAIVSRGLTVVPMPVAEAVLSISAPIEGPGSRSVVIASDIPGLRSQANPSPGTVVFNGTIGGWVTLGTRGVCGALPPGSELKPHLLEANSLLNYLTPNVTYSVPLRSSVGYEASLELSSALRVVGEAVRNRTQFTANDVAKVNASGALSQAFQFRTVGVEAPMVGSSPGALSPRLDELIERVKTSLYAQLLERLATAGVINVVSASEAPNAVNGGYTAQTRLRESCSRNRGPFGLWDNGATCSQVTYEVQQWNDGLARNAAEQSDTTRYQFRESVSQDGVIYRIFTATFVRPDQLPAN